MQRPTLLAALALSLTLTACGGGSSDPRELVSSGNRALGSGDFEAAMADFQSAADAIGADDALYLDVQKGLLRAKAGAKPADAIADLGTLSSDLGDSLDVDVYSSVAAGMTDAGHFDEAVAVITMATERFGKTELLDTQVASIMKKMKNAGAEDALGALAGLGYVGD